MSALDQHARAILQAARDADGPTRRQRERTGRKLALRIAAGASVTAVASSTWALSVAKVLVPALVLVGAGSGGAWWWTRSAETPPVAAPGRLAPLAPAAPVPVMPEATRAPEDPSPVTPEAEAAAPRRTATRKPTPSSEPVKASSLEEETALLSRVNLELRSGRAVAALQLLDEYDRRFPKAVLGEESVASRVVALCLAKSPKAQANAQRFLQAHPGSPQVRRVQRACLP